MATMFTLKTLSLSLRNNEGGNLVKPRVSIILPVYNVERYLDAALVSIKEQTLTDYEVIAVNDGSTDGSLAILQQWQKPEKLGDQLKIINQENKGLSGARDSGIRVATGDYIYFMDSDDIIDRKLLEKCVSLADKNQLDAIQIEYQHVDDADCLVDGNTNPLPLENGAVITRDEYLQSLYGFNRLKRKIPLRYHAMVWCYFIKRDILVDNDLYFYSNVIHEDELFTPKLLFYVQKIGYIKEPLYHYRMSDNSITRNNEDKKQFNTKRSQSIKQIVQELIAFYHQHENKMDQVYQKFIKQKIFDLSSIYIYMPSL